MSKVNMAVNIAGVEWKNPITVASGRRIRIRRMWISGM